MSFRRQRSESSDEQTEVNLTPMLDVVFIMLIFFIVTATFVRDPGAIVQRPTARTAEKLEGGTVLVALTSQDQLFIDKRRVDVDAVRPMIERLLLENPQSSVVIQADTNSTHGLFVQVIDEARAAGAERIYIAAEED